MNDSIAHVLINFFLFFCVVKLCDVSQGMSSSAPIVPTKVLGDPEELERHLAMHQNGGFQVVDPFVGNANDLDNNAALLGSIGAFDDRFIFTPPTLELQQSDVQLHASFFQNIFLIFSKRGDAHLSVYGFRLLPVCLAVNP